MPSPSKISELTADELRAQLGALAASQAPLLIGVRHHSPTLAANVDAMLDAFDPDVVLIELPMEFAEWLPWLGHADLHAPVALAASADDGGLSFYPFANFSPELAAVRWAVKHQVEVAPFDLPSGTRAHQEREHPEAARGPTLSDLLMKRYRADGFESLWDRMVEVHAAAHSPESLRRAGLYVGWTLRHDAMLSGGIPRVDLLRETHMRARLTEHGAWEGKRVAAVVGAFHAAALLEDPHLFTPVDLPSGVPAPMTTSLIPYAFELLDSRSSYPAGIRDPMWQERIYNAVRDGRTFDEVVADAIVTICRKVRELGHVAGVPDANAAASMTLELARLRGLPSPGRQELIESIQSSLARGEVLGRGRVLARAMDAVLVGRGRGRLAPKTPRSGLGPHVEDELERLGLPGPGSRSEEPRAMRLDPLRSDRDRERHLLLERLEACGIPYGKREDGQAIGSTDTITVVWELAWRPATDALLESAGVWGPTLEQAALGALRSRERRLRDEDRYGAEAMLVSASTAAECGLRDAASGYLQCLATDFLDEAPIQLVLAALAFLDAVERGHIPGLIDFELPPEIRRREFLAAAIRAMEGAAGSDDPSDARALIELVTTLRHQPEDDELGSGRLAWLAESLMDKGSPTMQGAATAAQLILERLDRESFAQRLASWLDAAYDTNARKTMSARLGGLLVAAGVLLESDADALQPLVNRIHVMPDDAFMTRLPALRRGFDTLSAAARDRLLHVLSESFPETFDPRGHRHTFELTHAPRHLALWKSADLAGAATLDAFGLNVAPALTDATPAAPEPTNDLDVSPNQDHAIAPLDRWRLILGREREKLPPQAMRLSGALDQLYGGGGGEGSGGQIGGQGGGKEDAFPNAREWADELEALFGERVRDEVLAQAALTGRHRGAILELDAETVRPSVELLETILSLKGGLSEAQLGKLRRLIRRITDELVSALATRLRPALSGLTTPRPTRRRGGPIDLRRTIEANLDHIWKGDDGIPRVIPEDIYFKTRSKRAIDWHISLVVDVSGSMEPSVIYSAMMAAILHGLPAVEVSFFAFNTQVIDLTDHVDDPLALLLEVEVGGGTHIARALRYARQRLRVPSRSIVLLVSDFEEGWAVDGLVEEVRMLADSGAHPLGLAALDDRGAPRYNKAIASLCVAAGMPVAALTPLELARWVGEKLHG